MNISDVVAQALLSGRADAIIAADRAGIIRFWNPGAEGRIVYLAFGSKLRLSHLRLLHGDCP
jgi:PAS domain-containing protein